MKRSKRLWAVILAVCLLALLPLSVSAQGGIEQTVTTISAVAWYNPRYAHNGSYCRLHLANGRTLYYVTGADCEVTIGQQVSLMYVLDTDWRGRPTRSLYAWSVLASMPGVDN